MPETVNRRAGRRSYLKYLAAVAVVAGAAAVGAYELSEHRKTETPASTPTTTPTPVPSPKPPTITSLEYKPSRIVNDKVYDISIALSVENSSRMLKELHVSLIPVEYPHLPREAFPKEETRTIYLQPRNLETETFSIDFTDLKGGREYSVQATTTDVARNIDSKEIKTPYVREFENIAPLDDVTVAAFYYNWYSPNYPLPTNLPDKPLLGLYNSDDDTVFNRHVDWATGHGIDVFVFPWFFPGTEPHRIFEKNMEADLFNQIKFSFISTFVDRTSPGPDHNFDDPKVKQDFIDNIEYIKDRYANSSNFWKIDGKPAIVSWSTHAYMSRTENIREAFKKVGSNTDLCIIGEIASNLAVDKKYYPFLEASVYGIYNYQTLLGPFHPWEMGNWPKRVNLPEILTDILHIMDEWSEFSKHLNMDYIPSVSPGNDKTYDYRITQPDPHPIVQRDSAAFKVLIDEVLSRYVPSQKNKIVFVTSFNEWYEQTQIEPALGYGLEYLNALKV